jgi:hypothetical protein
MKSKRLTLLVSPKLKTHLASESARTGVSIAEYVRSHFERDEGSQEAELAALVLLLRSRTAEARESICEGLAEADAALLRLRAARASRENDVRQAAM